MIITGYLLFNKALSVRIIERVQSGYEAFDSLPTGHFHSFFREKMLIEVWDNVTGWNGRGFSN